MPKPEKRYWYAALCEEIEALSAHDLMDMLRYDAARVECNPPFGFYVMSKAEAGGYPPPNASRWASFQVLVVVVSIGTHQPDSAEVVRAFEAYKRMNQKGGVR